MSIRWQDLATGAALVLGIGAVAPLPAAGTLPLPPVATVVSNGRDALVLGFDVLAAFPYAVPEMLPAGQEQSAPKQPIPAAVQAFSGKRAVVSGYMLPLQLQEGRARQFLLVRNQASCCYGVAPAMNEYVLVTMANEGVRPVMDVPITVVGTIKVGETYEEGLLVGIYQLDGEKIDTMKL
jgi:hypothetical protein